MEATEVEMATNKSNSLACNFFTCHMCSVMPISTSTRNEARIRLLQCPNPTQTAPTKSS